MTQINRFKVKEGDKEMEVLIPDTGDRQYNEYLEEAQREITANQLRKKQDKPKPTASKSDVAEALKEYKAYQDYIKQGHRRKYY